MQFIHYCPWPILDTVTLVTLSLPDSEAFSIIHFQRCNLYPFLYILNMQDAFFTCRTCHLFTVPRKINILKMMCFHQHVQEVDTVITRHRNKYYIHTFMQMFLIIPVITTHNCVNIVHVPVSGNDSITLLYMRVKTHHLQNIYLAGYSKW